MPPPATGTATTTPTTRPRTSSTAKKDEGNPDFALSGIGNYVFEKTLGQGNFAKVKLAKHKITALEVAIKIIDKTNLDEKKLSKLHREVRIMKMLNHPNIVKLYEVIETKHTLFLVMEYISGGELYDYLVAHGRMKERDARIKFRQILSAVNYCHKKRVIHRDLKAENLLLDANLNIKIADFGFSNQFIPDGQLDTFCGSPPYAAPELFQGRKYTGPEVDIWSLGVILYVLCTGCLPFDGKDLKEMREVVCRGRYKVPFYLSDTCEKLLRKFLVRDPTKRASLDVVADDPWVNEGFSDPCITKDPPVEIAKSIDPDVIGYMEEKLHISRDQTTKSLEENNYDDIGAIYLLLLDQKQHGKLNYVPGTYSNGANSNFTSIASISVLPAGSTPRPSALPMGTIGEDSPASFNNAEGAAPRTQTRERSHTVSGAATTAFNRQRPVTWVAPDNKVMEELAKQAGLSSTSAKGSGNKLNTATPLPQAASNSNSSGTRTASNGNQDSLRPTTTTTNQHAAATASPSNGHRAFNLTMRQTTAPTSALREAAETAAAQESKDKETAQDRPTSSRFMGALRSIGRRGTDANQQSAQENDQPVGGADDKPRSLRFTFNSSTTSSKAPEEIVREIQHTCQKLSVKYAMNGKFLLECTWNYRDAPLKKDLAQRSEAPRFDNSGDDGTAGVKVDKDTLRFDVEVCELPRLKNLHGLRFKRVGGPSHEYKEVCERILAITNL